MKRERDGIEGYTEIRESHNEGLIVLYIRYHWSDQNKGSERNGACSTHGEVRNKYRILFGKRERMRSFGTRGHMP
jgi:hypothetical protein